MRLYVLALEQNKYYVGVTNKTAEDRFEEHRNATSTASAWTRRYPPLRIMETYTVSDNFEENNKVKHLMNIHGIDNVRGGSYSTVQLDATKYDCLQRELDAANGRCYHCGSSSHYATKCTARTSLSTRKRDRIMMDNNDEYGKRRRTTKPCWRCGRTSHFLKDCFARHDVYGNVLTDDTDSEYSTDTESSTDSC